MIWYYFDWTLYQQQRIFQTNKGSINRYYLDIHIWFWVIELQAVIFIQLKNKIHHEANSFIKIAISDTANNVKIILASVPASSSDIQKLISYSYPYPASVPAVCCDHYHVSEVTHPDCQLGTGNHYT